MGTRHLVCVWVDGTFKVAQYGQFDGYPGGAGYDILKILREIDLEQLKEKVRLCQYIEKEKLHKLYMKFGMDAEGYWSIGSYEAFRAAYPQLHREVSADVIKLIYERNGLELIRNLSFAEDSLFCEWAYVVDLDDMKLEVHKGYNKKWKRPGGKFKGMFDDFASGYGPVTLLHTFDLNPIPTNEEFMSAIDKELEKEN